MTNNSSSSISGRRTYCSFTDEGKEGATCGVGQFEGELISLHTVLTIIVTVRLSIGPVDVVVRSPVAPLITCTHTHRVLRL